MSDDDLKKCPHCECSIKDLLVISECSQIYNVADKEHKDLQVEGTIRVSCYQCCKKLPIQYHKLIN